MKTTFVAQPFVGGTSLAQFLTSATSDPQFTRISVVVAWAKRSGLQLCKAALESFQKRGGYASLLVGISEGGATSQGLRLAMKMFTTVKVVHDVKGSTFHPKIYLVSGSKRAKVLIGSHNLTKGGMHFNHEAGVVVELDLGAKEDRAFLKSIEAYVNKLDSDGAMSIALTPQSLQTLISDPRYQIQNEDLARNSRGPTGAEAGGASAAGGGSAALFTRSASERMQAPAAQHSSAPSSSSGTSHPSAKAPKAARTVAVDKRWFKKMSQSDAQQLGGNSNPTGHLTLVKAGHPIDHLTWFRGQLFDTQDWTSSGQHETATIEFDVTVNGQVLGKRKLQVSHTPSFEASQGNRATVLHWGPLADLLSRNDFTGAFCCIERLANGSFKLQLGTANPGPMIP